MRWIVLCLVLLFGISTANCQVVSLNMNEAKLSDAFVEISKQTKLEIAYSKEIVDIERTISINVTNTDLIAVLNELLQGTDLIHMILNGKIIIGPKAVEPEVFLENKNMVKGEIKDQASGEPIAGVNIVVEGAKSGTISDELGNYLLKVNKMPCTLIYSYIGYQTERITVKTGDIVNVYLIPNTKTLDEVVVIGYGSIRKSNLTGSVSSINGESLLSRGASSFDLAMQGLAAGVNVTSNSGLPGAGTTIRIRGTGSINSGNDPLIVIDGMPAGTGPNVAGFINPTDIDKLEILKDASAAAIYGSQGANGVIIITTKRGKKGTPKLTFDSFLGVKSISKTWIPGDAAQFGQIYLLSKKASSTPINDIVDYYKPYYWLLDDIDFEKNYAVAQNELYRELKKNHVTSTDWLDALYQNGFAQNYNLTLSGGSENFRYASSVNFYNESGIIKKTGYERLSFRLNSDYFVTDKIRLGSNLTIVNSNRLGVNPLFTTSTTGSFNFGTENSLLSQAYQIDPITPIIRSREEVIGSGGDPNNAYNLYSPSSFTSVPNPVAGLERNNLTYGQFQLFGNGFMEIDVFKNISFRTSFGINLSRGNEKSFNPSYYISGHDRNLINSVKRVSDASNSWNWINQLNYEVEVGKHLVNTFAAIDASHSISENIMASAQGLPSNDPQVQYLHLAKGNSSVEDQIHESALVSYIGRINYGYDNKYLITATIRRDGSSKFEKDFRWGNFKSFSFGYRISEESFFKNSRLKELASLKIKGGWGQLGNAFVPPYITKSLYNGTRHISYPIGPVATYSGGDMANYPYHPLAQGILPNTIGTSDLIWETQEQANFGADLGLWNDNLKITAEYYIRTSKDNLLQMPVPPHVGYMYLRPWSNVGKIENRGFEFTLDVSGTSNLISWNAGGNIGINKNKVLSLGYPNAELFGIGYRFSGIPHRTVAERPIGDFYGFKTDGIFQTQEEVQNHIGINGDLLQPNAKPGDFRFLNVNNDNVLDDDDKQVLGSPLPKYTLGFYFNFGFKRLQLKSLFQGQLGNKILMYEKYFIYRGQGVVNSIKGLADISWHGPGTSNHQPRISASDLNDNFRMSDYYLEDGSYVRLKVIQLEYELVSKLFSGLGLKSVLLYVSGENVFTLTKYPGIDPEINLNDIWKLGISSFEYPQPKSYRIGIRAGF